MRALYTCVENGKVAVFESPTGDDAEPEWMLEYAKRESSRAITEKRKAFELRLAKARQEEEKQKAALESSDGPRKRQKFVASSRASDPQNEDHFALDDYDSEGEDNISSGKRTGHSNSLSTGTLELLERFHHKFSTQSQEGKDDGDEEIKIFYCSRTHSQLTQFANIEDMGKLGKEIGICPYYASRSAIKHSEVVALPYPLLLQRSAREALDLSVKGHVVIIDEAHNLMDAIANIHSVTITLSQLQTSIFQLTTLVTSITGHLQAILEKNQASEGPVQPSDLMSGKGVDQINPYKLCRYLQESKLARKVDGWLTWGER
ncbi:ATP-dependent DNA helicase chl1 [Aspergillus hancockii]|nr:ATP-dependent DNA helicase chl1 [Aspergillus hancockii]